MAEEDGGFISLGERQPSFPRPLQGRTSVHQPIRRGEPGGRAQVLPLHAEGNTWTIKLRGPTWPHA